MAWYDTNPGSAAVLSTPMGGGSGKEPIYPGGMPHNVSSAYDTMMQNVSNDPFYSPLQHAMGRAGTWGSNNTPGWAGGPGSGGSGGGGGGPGGLPAFNPWGSGAHIPGVVAPGNVTAPGNPFGAAPVNPAYGQSFTGGQIAPNQYTDSAGNQTANPFGNSFGAGQQSLMGNLQGIMNGTPGASAAENQAYTSGQQNLANTFALANSQHGAANPAATRTALETGAAQGGATQQAAIQGRLNEQLGAASQLGSVTAAGMGENLQAGQQGLSRAISQGQIDQDTAKTVYDAAQRAGLSTQQTDMAFQQLSEKYQAMGMDAQTANQKTAVDIQKLIQSGALGQADIQMKNNIAKLGMAGGFAGGIGTILASLISSGAKTIPGTTADAADTSADTVPGQTQVTTTGDTVGQAGTGADNTGAAPSGGEWVG